MDIWEIVPYVREELGWIALNGEFRKQRPNEITFYSIPEIGPLRGGRKFISHLTLHPDGMLGAVFEEADTLRFLDVAGLSPEEISALLVDEFIDHLAEVSQNIDIEGYPERYTYGRRKPIGQHYGGYYGRVPRRRFW